MLDKKCKITSGECETIGRSAKQLHTRNTKQQGNKHECEPTNNKCKTTEKM